MTLAQGVPTISRKINPLTNSTIDRDYYVQRANEAAAKREASKAKREDKEKRLRAIAADIRSEMTLKAVAKKWGIGYSGLMDARADIAMNRY